MVDHSEKTQGALVENQLFIQQLVTVEQVHVNLSQAVIVTTEDKLELCLNKHLKRAERKYAWVTPAGICLAILTTLVTTSFKDFVLSANTWNALFILVGIASLVWLIVALNSARESVDTRDIIRELKSTIEKKTKSNQ